MRRINRLFILLLVSTLVTGCGSPRSADLSIDPTDSTSSESIFERLTNEGTFEWTEDRFSAIVETKVEHIYFGGDCAVWEYPSESDVAQANENGELDFYQGEVWFGGDSLSSKGVALLTESKSSKCARVVFQVLGWSTEDEGYESSNTSEVGSTTLEGKWGSYSWMEDQVGMFLIIKKLEQNTYQGVFYSQGQSGGVFKDSTVDIVDLGDGLAEVTWPSGNQTTATWGKRDANTPSNMDPNWDGDIWFDCLDEVDFASSRADCNFFLSR